MKRKIICAVMTGVIAATCATPAFACTPPIRIDMSWKRDMNKALSNIKVSVPNVVIPKSYFDNIKFN